MVSNDSGHILSHHEPSAVDGETNLAGGKLRVMSSGGGVEGECPGLSVLSPPLPVLSPTTSIM